MEKRSPKGWIHYLSDDDGQYTLTEFMAGCLSRILGNMAITAQATEHLEGMVGAIDEMCSRGDPNYKGDGAVRAALDARRDEQRRQLPP